MRVRSRLGRPGVPPLSASQRAAGPRAGLLRPFAGACAGGRARSEVAGGLPVRAREGRGRPEAGWLAGGWLLSRRRQRWRRWLRRRRRVAGPACAGWKKTGGGNAAACVRSAEAIAALEPLESAETLRAGVGGFGSPPGHGGRGRWLRRQRCGPGLCEAGTVWVLTPSGPSQRHEAEPLPRPTAAAAARPPRGWGSSGGRTAPVPAPAPAPASAAREAETGGASRAQGARGQGAGREGWGPGGRGWGGGT